MRWLEIAVQQGHEITFLSLQDWHDVAEISGAFESPMLRVSLQNSPARGDSSCLTGEPTFGQQEMLSATIPNHVR